MQADRHLQLLAAFLMAAVVGIRYGLAANPITAGSLLNVLEHRFPRADIGDGHGIAGVIALGGNPARIREAARLAAMYPHLKLVVTGEGPRSEMLSLIGPNIAPGRVLVEEAARNTYENAVFVSRITDANEGSWILVTSASHMPRAVGSFRKAGFDVIAWPIFDLTNQSASIERVIQHECLGLIAYWALGRTNALWPDSESPSRLSS